MLVFVARLQRYDVGLTEAALDLGATHVQAFRKIQLPFLMPAVGSASVLAFLASFENYNTTAFTFQKYPTLTIELAQKVRYGIDPSISMLAFIIVVLTVFFALVHEVRTRRAQLAVANGAPVGAVKGGFEMSGFFTGNPAAVALAVFVGLFVLTTVVAQFYDPEPAKVMLLEEKRAAQQERIKQLQERMRQRRLQKQFKGPDIFGAGESKVPQPVTRTPAPGVFAPTNLDPADGEEAEPKKPAGAFGDVFNPGNLEDDKSDGQ